MPSLRDRIQERLISMEALHPGSISLGQGRDFQDVLAVLAAAEAWAQAYRASECTWGLPDSGDVHDTFDRAEAALLALLPPPEATKD